MWFWNLKRNLAVRKPKSESEVQMGRCDEGGQRTMSGECRVDIQRILLQGIRKSQCRVAARHWG